MRKNLQLLKLKDVINLHSSSKRHLLEEVTAQFRRQHSYLNKLRIRRQDVLQCFEDVVDNATKPEFDYNSWTMQSKRDMSQTFDKILADARGWHGKGVTEKSLIQPFNDMCYHNLNAMMCLDLLSHDSNGEMVSDVAASQFIHRIIEDVSSFSKEKFGVCPEINIQGETNLRIVPPFIEFIIVEVLKNAIKAVVDRYGALDIDDADPIEIHISKTIALDNEMESGAIIEFCDRGVGMDDAVAKR